MDKKTIIIQMEKEVVKPLAKYENDGIWSLFIRAVLYRHRCTFMTIIETCKEPEKITWDNDGNDVYMEIGLNSLRVKCPMSLTLQMFDSIRYNNRILEACIMADHPIQSTALPKFLPSNDTEGMYVGEFDSSWLV